MSYGVDIRYRDTDHELFWRNYTSNCSRMWRDAGCDLAEFDGKTTDELLPSITAAITVMEANPARYRAMNPLNGWGSYETCLDFLAEVRDACAKFTGEKVHVSR